MRAFLPKPVPREAVVEILEAARRAPSGGNLQPWQVHVLGGEVLDEFRSLVAERSAAKDRRVLHRKTKIGNLCQFCYTAFTTINQAKGRPHANP